MNFDLVSSPLSNVDAGVIDAALSAAASSGSGVVHGGAFGIGEGYDVTAEVVAPGVIAVSVQHPTLAGLSSPSGLFGPLGPEKPELALYVVRPDALPPSVGYAISAGFAAAGPTSAAAPPASAAHAPTSSSSAASKKTNDLAFLDSKSMSIEDKIMMFMAVMGKRADAELVDQMKDYQAKQAAAKEKKAAEETKAAAEKKAQDDGGGGPFGFLGDIVGGIVDTVESAVKLVGGPLAAAAATALGAPFLAPVALKIGGQLGAGLVETLATGIGVSPKKKSTGQAKSSAAKSSSTRTSSTSAATRSTSTKTTSTKASAAAADDAEFDEQYAMLELQRLMQTQERLFSAMSNVMKAIHDGQMVAIQNVK